MVETVRMLSTCALECVDLLEYCFGLSLVCIMCWIGLGFLLDRIQSCGLVIFGATLTLGYPLLEKQA